MLVVRKSPSGIEQLEHMQTGTRLGEGLRDSGPLAPEAKMRTLAAVTEFAAHARAHEATIACIATSAMRRASDARTFAEDVYAATGASLEILDGATEATASYRGATYNAPRDGARVAVLDIGGGSTECAVGRDDFLEAARSIEIGSVRLTERFVELGGGAPGALAREVALEARAQLQIVLAPIAELAPVDRLIAVAGTALTIGAVVFGTHVTQVSGLALTRETVDGTIERLLDLTLEERRALPGMLAQRADVLVAGGLILSETLRLLDVHAVHLESDDLLLGYLLWDGRGGAKF
jgi:exopolyphosphatase/guanosine-5'-triphosphate,3'-diphosphate pyrophosphatase